MTRKWEQILHQVPVQLKREAEYEQQNLLIMVQRRNRKMQIFVDADACPVVAIVEKIAKEV